jgi:anti-sigma B factor antagonist
VEQTRFIEEGELVIRVDHESGAEVLSLYGELDHSTAQVFESALLGSESRDTDAIILDLSGLEFCDSTGLGVIIRAATRSRQDSDRLAMLRARDQVQRLLAISGLEEHLPFID